MDTNNCHRSNTLSSEAGEFFNESVAYSYETCGNVDTYSTQNIMKVITDKTLRVSYPGDSSDGYTLATDEATGNRIGSTVDLMYEIFEEYNITAVLKEVSEKSKARYTSSYTQCVHEVALNETDICIGAFWTTSERLLLTPFTTATYQDTFYMLTFEETTETGFWVNMATPFAPFTTEAWYRLAFVVLYMSTSIHLVQSAKNAEDEDDDDETKSLSNNHTLKEEPDSKKSVGRAQLRRDVKKYGGIFGNNIFYGVTSFAKGEVTSESDGMS